MAPIIAILAMAAIRKHQRNPANGYSPEEEEEFVPEPPPGKAAKFYNRRLYL
jgi:hypothetical protein